MYAAKVSHAIERIPGLADNSRKVADAIHNAILGDDRARKVVDILHGTWLGHPLHPVLTDVPIGAWTIAVMCDLVAAQHGSDEAAKMADALTAIGVVAAVPTALTGIADFSAIDRSTVAPAGLHGLLNSAGLVLNILSIRDRRTGNRGRGVLFSTVAFGLLSASAWIGGELVNDKKVGVKHFEEPGGPQQWRPVLDSADLAAGTPKRIDVEGAPVMLYREDANIYAIGATCGHAYGPLDEGKIDRLCVECPWHHSVFDLRDGSVVHGPATYPQPAYDTRTRNGQIELRLRPIESR